MEHWEYDEDAFRRLVHVSEGCSTVAYKDDQAVGMTFGFPWGPVGWIGSVLTHEDHRGEGIGQDTVEASLDRLIDHGCSTVKLYSTPQAIPLYERVGFQGEAEFVIAHGSQRRGRDPDVVPLQDRLDEVKALDADVFPGDRTRWLDRLVKEETEACIGVLDDEGALAGYGMARVGPHVTEIGPVVVQHADANAAQDLVDGLLVRVPEQPVELIYPKNGTAARTSWACRGFVSTETPLEMRWGDPVDERRDSIVAAGGQELG